MNTIIAFVINVLLIALPIAVFEIIIEKDKGWGAGLPKNTWYGKQMTGRFFEAISRFAKVPNFLRFQVAIYFILLPILIAVEYFLIVEDINFLIAVFFATLVTEDFLWFVINWNFNSLSELLKGPNGKIWWHKKWVRIWPDNYLPRSYFIAAILIVVFLFLSEITYGI